MRHTVTHGMLGMGSSAGGIYVSFLPHLEMWLRIASLVVGLLVGLVSLRNLWRGKVVRQKVDTDPAGDKTSQS